MRGCVSRFILSVVLLAAVPIYQADTNMIMLTMDKNEWMWFRGSNMGNQPSTLAESSPGPGADTQQQPGARAGAATWRDRHGNLWMFGGRGFDHHETEAAHELNDLWMFNSSSHRWQLMHAGGTGGHPRTGQRRVPGPRWGAAACGVDGIVMIVFGGEDAARHQLYDTWVFEIQTKKWLPLFVRVAGKGGERPAHPGGRTDVMSWCHRDKLVVFGGLGTRRAPLDDMWLFSLRDLHWYEVSQVINSIDVTQSATAVLFPEARTGGSAWVGNAQRYYLFGGNKAHIQFGGFESHDDYTPVGDMWYFNVATGNVSKNYTATWTLIHVDEQGRSSPAGRQHTSTWTDYRGYLWLYGGQNTAGGPDVHFLADTFMFRPKQSAWSLAAAPAANRTRVPLKSRGHLLPEVSPSPRCHPVAWTHKNITYVFGGYGLDALNKVAFLSDLWVFVQPFTSVPGDLFAAERGAVKAAAWLHHLPPLTVFSICLGTFGGLALVFGTAFFLKKMLIDYPRHNPNAGFNVRYSPLKDEANFEMW